MTPKVLPLISVSTPKSGILLSEYLRVQIYFSGYFSRAAEMELIVPGPGSGLLSASVVASRFDDLIGVFTFAIIELLDVVREGRSLPCDLKDGRGFGEKQKTENCVISFMPQSSPHQRCPGHEGNAPPPHPLLQTYHTLFNSTWSHNMLFWCWYTMLYNQHIQFPPVQTAGPGIG